MIWIGASRNLGVLIYTRIWLGWEWLQKGSLYFNEYVDDKRLVLWLKSLFDFCAYDDTHEAIKLKVLSSYTATWQFLYSTYHGKCLE